MQGPEAPELELICVLPPWVLFFIVPEDAMQAATGGKQPTALPSHDITTMTCMVRQH